MTGTDTFQTFYETAPVALLVLAPDPPRFTILAVSEAYLRATRTTRDIVGRGIFEVFPDDPGDAESTGNPARASFERVLSTGAPDTMAVQKHSIPRPPSEGGGFEERYWSPVNTPVLGPGGTVLYIHHRVEDVTEFVRQKRKGAEQDQVTERLKTRFGDMEADVLRRAQELQEVNRELRGANQRLAELDREREQRSREQTALLYAISDTSTDAIFAKDRDGRLRFANPATLALIGRSLEEALGRTDAEILGDREAARRVMENDRRVMASGVPEEMEERVPLPDGTERVWLSRKVPYRDALGNVIGLLGISRDITDRGRAEAALRTSEQRLGLAFDAARAAAWEVNLVTGHHFWEDRFFPLLAVPPEAMAEAQQRWAEFVLPEDRDRAAREFLDASAEGGPPYDSTFRAPRMDGVVRWFRSRGIQLRDPDGGRRMVGFVQDVTDRKDAEQALLDANEKLREADRRKDEFLGMLSHELRNPLAPIRTSTYVLRHAQPGGDQARRAQAVIERQAEHLTRLVDDLLDVTRIARGKIELRRDRVDLREVVSRSADDFRLLMQDRGVRFQVALPDEPLWADADATRITQVVGNLLHNASKFTRSGEEVALSLGAGAGAAEIRVRDTGSGIDAALLPRLFDAFVQGDRTLARTEGGLGLGLALVKGIAELHGGSVRAESAGKGKGAQFTVRVPLAEATTAAGDVPTRVLGGTGGRRVLVVDDNRDAAQSLADLVAMLGHDVDVAYDGPGALERARAHPPDLVLCDIGLPGMSGYQLAQMLREEGTAAQLFAVSGYAQPEDVKRAIEAGFDGHLAKPVDPEQIERLLS